METFKVQCSVIVLQWDKHSVLKSSWSQCVTSLQWCKASQTQQTVVWLFQAACNSSCSAESPEQMLRGPAGSCHLWMWAEGPDTLKLEGAATDQCFTGGDFSTSVWDIKLFFKGAWLCWGTLTTWLGSRGSAFLHGGGGGRNLVERSLLVNEPAVTCPQDQVQKAKNLQKHMKTQVMTFKCKTWEKEDRKTFLPHFKRAVS